MIGNMETNRWSLPPRWILARNRLIRGSALLTGSVLFLVPGLGTAELPRAKWRVGSITGDFQSRWAGFHRLAMST